MPEVPDFQSVMLEKARQDAQAAGAMLDEPRVSDEIIGFHCQQAMEKSVKAVLESLRIEYPLTHDLVLLLDLLSGRAPVSPEMVADATWLNPFAVKFRYVDYDDAGASGEDFDRRRAVRAATEAVEWATRLVKR